MEVQGALSLENSFRNILREQGLERLLVDVHEHATQLAQLLEMGYGAVSTEDALKELLRQNQGDVQRVVDALL